MTALKAKAPQHGACQQGNAVVTRNWIGKCARTNGVLVLTGGFISGCINIAAPEAPIVIELNINIRQEVIYRLAADAANTIDENSDIF
jgi:hypothetical protein